MLPTASLHKQCQVLIFAQLILVSQELLVNRHTMLQGTGAQRPQQ